MVTKLKNIKIRVIAFILAILFFAVSGYFSSAFVRSFVNYNTYENRGFENTDVFRRMIYTYEASVMFSAESKSVKSAEEFKNTTNGKEITADYETKVKKINEAFDLLDNSKIQVFHSEDNVFRYRLPNGNVVYYFGYDGSIINKQTFESIEFYDVGEDAEEIESTTFTEVKEDIQKISNALGYLYNLGSDTNYGETTRDIVLKRAEQEYQRYISEAYENSSNGYSVFRDNIKSVKYAVFLTNGNVVSNCGITKADTQKTAAEKLGNGAVFLEEFRDGKYYQTTETRFEQSNSVTAQINREICTAAESYRVINPTENCGIQSAVFAYAGSFTDEADLLTVFNDIYGTFSNSVGGRASSGMSVAMLAVFFILAAAICILLLVTAGKTADGSIRLLFTDKVPLAINLVFYGGIASAAVICCCGGLACEYYTDIGSVPLGIVSTLGKKFDIIWGILFALFFGAISIQLNSIVRNIRAKTFWRHTLCRWIFLPVRIISRKLKCILETSYANADGKRKKRIAILCTCVFAVADFCLIAVAPSSDFLFFLVLLFNIAVLVFAIMIINSYSRIAQATREIREGQLEKTVSTEKMLPFFKDHAEDINSIGDGLQNAVEGAVRDQRMKAELITNVSHDLKTPLTSIVNYVDLLKRCEIENEDAKKYLNILDEKSQRMKKLIEDLVEASKASSGAVEMYPVSLNLCEFATQVSGENEDELKAKGIEIILKTPKEPVTVFADAQKTGRIIENLLTNIKKYALENTRAYIEVRNSEKNGIIEFKNISKYELNIPAEELTARFVRGDASRNGEGSGLGLSIASNFCRLQGGNLEIIIDGDLFKAVVTLPKG